MIWKITIGVYSPVSVFDVGVQSLQSSSSTIYSTLQPDDQILNECN